MIINNTVLISSKKNITNDKVPDDTSGKKQTITLKNQIKQGDSIDISVTAKMTARLNGLHQALHNINKGYSLVNITDGHLSQVQDILQKIRIIAVKASHGTYTLEDTEMLQVEVSELIDEIDRIASQAEYNKLKLITGSFSDRSPVASIWFQIGPNMHQKERIFIRTMTARSIGLKNMIGIPMTVSTPDEANMNIGVIDNALWITSKQRANLFGYSQRLNSVAKGAITEMEEIMKSENVYSDKKTIRLDIAELKKRMQIK